MASSSSSSLSTVQVLKRSLSKHISSLASQEEELGNDASSSSSSHVEAAADLLGRLDECDVTLEALTETLVGTVVSKLKGHPALGAKAKALIRKWKAVARQSEAEAAGNGAAGKEEEEEGASAPTKGAPSSSAKPSKRAGSIASSSSAAAADGASKKKRRSTSAPSLEGKASSGVPPSRLDRRESGAATIKEKDNADDDDDNNEEEEEDPSVYWSHLPEPRQNICRKLNSVLLLAKPRLLGKDPPNGEGDGPPEPASVHADALPHLIGQRAAEIEGAIHAAFPNSAKPYADKARSLFFNLKKNVQLSASVVLGGNDAGGISPADLVGMSSEQLASDDVRTSRAREAQRVIDSKRLDWEQANEDKINEMCGIRGDLLKASLFTCGRCKSTKTTSTQKQTRSADEPMTVFVLCINCGKRWKC
jgi:transcription elongation factor S-II